MSSIDKSRLNSGSGLRHIDRDVATDLEALSVHRFAACVEFSIPFMSGIVREPYTANEID